MDSLERRPGGIDLTNVNNSKSWRFGIDYGARYMLLCTSK